MVRRRPAAGPISRCSQPVKDYPHRQPSTLLVFDAVERALDEIAARAPGERRSYPPRLT